MKKDRIEWVDAFRFLGIFAIYLGHLGEAAGKFYGFVFLYHVQLFFFAAGFFSGYKKNNSLFDFVTVKFKRLVLPYLFFSSLTLILYAIKNQSGLDYFIQGIPRILYGVRNDEIVAGSWFLNCLFVMYIIDYMAVKILKSSLLVIIASLISLAITQYVLHSNPLAQPAWFMNIDSALLYWWLMPAGRALFPVINRIKNFNMAFLVFIFFALGAFSFYTLFNTSHLYMDVIGKIWPSCSEHQYFRIMNYMAETLTLIAANICIAMVIGRIALFRNIGENTLNLCGFEAFTKTMLPVILSVVGLSVSFTSALSSIAYTMIALLASHYLSTRLSKHYPLFAIK